MLCTWAIGKSLKEVGGVCFDFSFFLSFSSVLPFSSVTLSSSSSLPPSLPHLSPYAVTMRLLLVLSLAVLAVVCGAEEARIFIDDDIVKVAGDDVHLVFGGETAAIVNGG
jgi:hypothetical protein